MCVVLKSESYQSCPPMGRICHCLNQTPADREHLSTNTNPALLHRATHTPTIFPSSLPMAIPSLKGLLSILLP